MGIIIRQSIKGTIVNYVGAGIGFITTFFVLTQFLTAEEIGLTSVLIHAATLFVGLAQLGTNSSIIRYYPYFKELDDKHHGFFFWTLVVPFIGFLIFGMFFLILKVPISNLFIEKSPLFVDYYYFVLPLSFFMLYQAIFETNACILMRIVVPKLIREIITRVLLLAVYLLYAFKILTLDGFVIAFCTVYAMATLCNIVYLFMLKRISLRPNFKYISKGLAKNYMFYSFFLIASALGGAITPTINTFFISVEMGLVFTGIFAIAGHMSAIIEIPYRSLGAITQPQISNEMSHNNITGVNFLCKQVSLHQFLASTFIFFVIWINIDLIFELLPNGEQYATGKWVVLILGASKLLNSSVAVGASVISYSKYYYFSLFFTLLLTVIAILLNNHLIPLWGINGAALSTLFSYLVYYIILLGFIAFKIKISPFSFNQLKIAIIVIALFTLNCIWVHFATPIFLQIHISELLLNIIDSIIRTTVLLIIGVFILYHWNISDQTNKIIDKLLDRSK